MVGLILFCHFYLADCNTGMKIIKNVSSRCISWKQNTPKVRLRPDPAGGAYRARPDRLLRGGEGREGREGRGKGKEGEEGKGKGTPVLLFPHFEPRHAQYSAS